MKFIVSFFLSLGLCIAQGFDAAYLRGLTSNVQGQLNLVSGARQYTLLPIRTGTNYWSLGDSQTRGEYNIVYDWTDASKILYPQFRYPNIIASRHGLNLTNLAVSSAQIATTSARPFNGLAQANAIPVNWSGLVTSMLGYNDSTAVNYGDMTRQNTLFRSAGNALIARLFASGWINPQGTNNNGVNVASFINNGGTVSDDGNAGLSPFPIGSPSTDTRKFLTMTNGNTVTFSATNPVVWMQTSTNGGLAQLWQGTNLVDQINTDTDDTVIYSLPQSMLGVGLSGSFTVSNVSGSTVLLAVGAVQNPNDASGKTVIIGSPLRLRNTARADGVGLAIGNALRSSVQDWSQYNIGFADAASQIDVTTMMPPADTGHPDPSGQKVIARAFLNAVRVDSALEAGSPGLTYFDRGVQAFGRPPLTAMVATNAVALTTQSGVGFIESATWPAYTFDPLEIRAKGTTVSRGHFQVSGAAVGASEYFPGNAIGFQMIGSNGHIDSINYNGTNVTFLPVYIRGSETRIANGTFRIASTGNPISRIRHGTATLSGSGTATVADTTVTANSIIMLTSQVDGGTPGWLRVSARTAGTSFTITSSSATDTSTVGWVMIEP